MVEDKDQSVLPATSLRDVARTVVEAILRDLRSRKGLRQVWEEEITAERQADIEAAWTDHGTQALSTSMAQLAEGFDKLREYWSQLPPQLRRGLKPNYYEIHLRALQREFDMESQHDHWPGAARVALRKAERWTGTAIRRAEQGNMPEEHYRDRKEEQARILTIRPEPYATPKE